MATKADLKALDQKFQGQMLGLQREMVELQRQMVSLNTNLEGQMLDLKTDRQGQMLGIKSGLNWRLGLPVATSGVTTFTAVGAIYVACTLSQGSTPSKGP